MYSLGRNSFRLEKKAHNKRWNEPIFPAKILTRQTDRSIFMMAWMNSFAYSKNPGLCLCSMWGPNWIWAWMPPNSQALSKETGCEPFRMSSLAWKTKKEKGFWVSGMSCQFPVSEHSLCNRSSHRRDVSDLHVEQIELDRVSGVDILVWVEELASEQKGLVLVHPLFSERPAVI